MTAALSVAGLPTDWFVFLGFLPRKGGVRRRALVGIGRVPWTLVMFEAPHRVVRTLRDLRGVLGDRQVAVMRELTKKFEEIVRGTVSEVADRMAQPPPRGELTLVVAGAEPVLGQATGRATSPTGD